MESFFVLLKQTSAPLGIGLKSFDRAINLSIVHGSGQSGITKFSCKCPVLSTGSNGKYTN